MAETQLSPEIAELYHEFHNDSTWLVRKTDLAAADSADHIEALGGKALGKTLDVGAGRGAVANQLMARGTVSELHAIEVSRSGLEMLGKIEHPLLASSLWFDGYSIPFADDEFDTAISMHVLEHVEHERKFLREVARVAKTLYIEVPLEGGLRGTINRTYGHINYYTPMVVRNLLETSGLRIVESKVFASSAAYEKHLYGPGKGAVRSFIRHTALSVLGDKSAEFMAYVMTIRCEKV